MTEDRTPDDENDPEKMLAQFLAQFGITPSADGSLDLNQVLARLQPVMSQFATQMAGYGPTDASSGLNWNFVRDAARRVSGAAGPDPNPTPAQRQSVSDAAALADLWLDDLTSMPRLAYAPAAWSRQDWLDQTFPTWQQVVRPVATSLAHEIATLGARQQPDDEQLAALQRMMQPMMSQSAGAMLGSQLGASLGHLATEVVSASDLGLPLSNPVRVALVPDNVAKFAEGLEIPASDVQLFLTIRETARQRLFAHAGWLGPQLLALVEHYAREIRIDTDALEQAIEQQLSGASSPADVARIGAELGNHLFKPTVTPEQQQVLQRLETLLALVEGWVDDVTSQAVHRWMPNAAPLIEAVRRRRAAGGPAEQALKSLVGLELRPRRMRDAANLWAALRSVKGEAARDAAWEHPDRIPSAADLDDPLGYAESGPSAHAPDAMDEALARLLQDEAGD